MMCSRKGALWAPAILIVLVAALVLPLQAATAARDYSALEKRVETFMKEGKIPGLTLVIVDGNEPAYIRGFGYADLQARRPVGADTLFELASCSKAFTALATARLAEAGKIDLDAPISAYFPGFHGTFHGRRVEITLRQALHHVSGIPQEGIALIRADESPQALLTILQRVNGIELKSFPGKRFEYSTVNYDLLGAVIEKVSGRSFEQYVRENVFLPLGMNDTFVGGRTSDARMAKGYKIGFFAPRSYQPPVFRGNFPAGYVVSNGRDMARWLSIQLGAVPQDFRGALALTQEYDKRVPPDLNNTASYAMGWMISLSGNDQVWHNGNNPTFTTFMGFIPGKRVGVAVLANANGMAAIQLGRSLLTVLGGEPFPKVTIIGDAMDKTFSVMSILGGFFLLGWLAFLIWVVVDLRRGNRPCAGFSMGLLGRILLLLLAYIPFLVGIYLIPQGMSKMPWDTALIWASSSFPVAVGLLLTAMLCGFLGTVISMLFPHRNKYLKSMPMLVLLSLISGTANAMVIFLVNRAIFSDIELKYQVFNFLLAGGVYVFGRKVLQTRLIKITFDIVYSLRMHLLQKISYTSYQRFEKLNRGRIFATLNDDTGQIGGAANLIVQMITSVITIVGAFVYLATVAFWATMVTLLVICLIAAIYYYVSRRTRVFFEKARDTRNVYMALLNGLVDGFKELSMQFNKKKEYQKEISDSVDEFRNKISTALIRFVNAFLVGESMLIVVLGAVGFAIPRLFPDIPPITLMGFIMVLLYLIGPINQILHAIPDVMQLRVAWNRVRDFIREIPANLDPKVIEAMDHSRPSEVESIEARGLMFDYDATGDNEKFSVGPMDFSAVKGEIVFIIGGNGSGKTTLAKLLTGLYLPREGAVRIDGQEISNYRLGEYFSVVFSNYHMFDKLYNVDLESKRDEIDKYLRLLRLDDKVALQGNKFSTLELSGGQRKRLALLQCYLEDAPIYLFDEIAADQDPEFRRFFYRELLPQMKAKGKIVIAITHDDHYFDVADRVIKMDMGKIDILAPEGVVPQPVRSTTDHERRGH